MIRIDKNIVKNEKGITLLTLLITVVLMIILTGVFANRSYSSLNLSKLTRLQNDIEMLNDRIAVYYIKENKLPLYKLENTDYMLTKDDLKKSIDSLAASDGPDYYIIDLNALDDSVGISTLNYGKKWDAVSSAETDKYIINEKTHIVYYVQGINFEGKMYHTVGKNI